MNDDSKVNNNRRRFLGTMAVTLASVPLLSLVKSNNAQAANLPHLTDKDPTAAALHYNDNATKAPRVAKSGVPAKKQFCHNCQFIQAKSGEWRPCQIYPGKLVNQNGWCTSWSKA